MSTEFKDFLNEIEAEAKAEGPEAVAQLKSLQDKFKEERVKLQQDLQKRPLLYRLWCKTWVHNLIGRIVGS